MAAVPGVRCPLLSLLLLLLLLFLPSPAQGNEGGAAGSCHCRRLRTAPKFPEYLESCDTCKDLTRFIFPQRRVCGLHEDPWVIEFKSNYCRKEWLEQGAGKADASRGDRMPASTSPTTVPGLTLPTSPRTTVPTPTSPRTVPAATSPSSVGVSPDESRESLWVIESHRKVTWVPVMARSTPEAPDESETGDVNKAPLEEKEAAPLSALDAMTPSVTVICILVVGFAVLMYCWKGRQRRQKRGGQRPQTPLEEEEEGRLCLPGENT